MLWPKGRIDDFPSEAEARKFRARFPEEVTMHVQSQSIDVEWTVGPWVNSDEVAHLYTRRGHRVHVISPDSTRFLCGIAKEGQWERVEMATAAQMCRRCTRRQ